MVKRFETFTVAIAKISRCIRKIKTVEMEEFDLKSPHVSCLYYLYKNNSTLTAKELCDVCDEDKSAISRSIEFLETSGYITCNSKTEKRYKSPLTLTEKGLEVGKQIAVKVDKIVDIASTGLSEEDRTMFYKGLLLICHNLEKICNEYGE